MSSSPKVISESGIHLSDKMSSPVSSSSRSQPTNNHLTPLPSNQNRHSRPLSEIIGESFPAFDHQTNIVAPFNDETNRDLAFEKGPSFTIKFRLGQVGRHVRAKAFMRLILSRASCTWTCHRAKDAHIARHSGLLLYHHSN
jgi:hypothetical protein